LVNCRACSIEGLEQGIAWVAWKWGELNFETASELSGESNVIFVLISGLWFRYWVIGVME
jgi:hypothetical protein